MMHHSSDCQSQRLLQPESIQIKSMTLLSPLPYHSFFCFPIIRNRKIQKSNQGQKRPCLDSNPGLQHTKGMALPMYHLERCPLEKTAWICNLLLAFYAVKQNRCTKNEANHKTKFNMHHEICA